jgi:hypothetical protein
LVVLVASFLAVQNRIDRNDPKLALAPVHGDRHLDFGPHPASTLPVPHLPTVPPGDPDPGTSADPGADR